MAADGGEAAARGVPALDTLQEANSILITNQFRLRDVSRISGHNIPCGLAEPHTFFYTLHRGADATPLFTSAEVSGRAPPPPFRYENSPRPAPSPSTSVDLHWPKLTKDFAQNSPLQSVVLRLWRKCGGAEQQILCCGVNFSGLVRHSQELQLRRNTLLFHTHAGHSFTAPGSIKCPFGDKDNDDDDDDDADYDGAGKFRPPAHLLSRFQCLSLRSPCESSVCSLDQLLRLQQSQLRLKYKRELLRSLVWEIQSNSGIAALDKEDPATASGAPPPAQFYRRDHQSHHHHNHHHHHHATGSMGKTLTRLLNMEPERVDEKTLRESLALRRRIEAVRVRCRLLALERDRAQRHVDALERRRGSNCDRNVETGSGLMAAYHGLSKEKEQYLHLKLRLTRDLDALSTARNDLMGRRQLLLRDLESVYDVREHDGGHYTINGISLPDAEAFDATHVPATSVSVALGYVAHTVLITSSVLALPLRNPILFKGSQSQIMGLGQVNLMNSNV